MDVSVRKLIGSRTLCWAAGLKSLGLADGGSSVLVVVSLLSEGDFTDLMNVFQQPTWNTHHVPQSQVLCEDLTIRAGASVNHCQGKEIAGRTLSKN